MNNEDYEYTIVLDGSYKNDLQNGSAAKDQVVQRKESTAADPGEQLYKEYETMLLRAPTVLDTDDIYPHTYYWRIGDRYDPAKLEVLKEALRLGKRIADTEAFEKYCDKVKKSRFSPDSWD